MSLLNTTRVKRLALDIAAKERPAARFSRVGSSFTEAIEAIEALVRNAVIARVRSHPSKGVTLQ